ncbi:16S rRNA (guanine(966)-N(2))-methyltransferase RsmD [Pantoea sp. Mhis]|uniref:16S rRNA (guanine(966)-N(2))-methyltransferase RsmD n=1 Tax=Pantoea sp. Mhis TaxID=2576759 RepID=UPI0013578E1F|nr:16S rRNA (guanine(966)-N(2))-methyltransferase RsmD [Pantoea sp. Mhis]
MIKHYHRNNHNNTGYVRLISGQWRKYQLPVLDVKHLRPTTDRIRETLFNWLNPYIQKTHCLDCFAGSGALGMEALSRYAESVTLLELRHIVVKQLLQNLKNLNTTRGNVVQTNTLEWLKQPGIPFDVVFVDPPFNNKAILVQTLKLLEQKNWLSDNALIYVESELKSGIPIVPQNWICYREKIAGQVSYRLYKRQ